MKRFTRYLKLEARSWKLAALLLLTGSSSIAQTVSLDSILSVVKERNPMLKNYGQRAEAMTAYAQGGKSWMAPEVGGGLWMLPYKSTEDPRDKGQIMLSVQQKFTSPAKLRANQGYLESKAAVEQASEKYVYNELKALTKTTYYQWIALEKKKKALQENEEIIQLVLKISKLRYPYNQSKLGNIYKAEARQSEIQNMMLMNDNQIHQKNILLNQLMNVPSSFRFSVDTSLQIKKLIAEESDTMSLAENRSDVQRIDKSIQSLRLNQALENSQSKPDFNISFNHMFARGAGMPNQFMLLGMVSIPIAPWSSKMYKANSQGLGKEIEAMKYERASLLNELQGMAAHEVHEIMTLSKQIENYETRIVPALKKNYETLMIAYEENKEELPEVIDAWETLNATQMQYLDAVQKYYEAIVNYEKILEKE
ncbi:MAG TPA: TolC family protein [Cyclobacteriaceae bacterium]|jgi:outer membrane protein TolC|nr:TolC family protein [Cyclobacteriaceae bacterium]